MVRNNYKSGRVATLMEGGYGGNEAQDPTIVGEPYKVEETNMNMNMLLFNNIRADMYFREELPHIKTLEAFCEKTVKEVRECTPWISGTHTVTRKKGMCSGTRGVGTQGRPTRMWLHLVKLYTMKPTERQLEMLVESKQSPYLRVLGFLEGVWAWLSPYIDETEEVIIERISKLSWPLGKLVRSLLTETKYFDTHFPRFSVKMQRMVNEGIKKWDLSQGRKDGEEPFGGADGRDRKEGDSADRRYGGERERGRSDHRRDRDRGGGGDRDRSRERRRDRSRDRSRSRRSRDRRGGEERDRERDRDRRRRDRSRSREGRGERDRRRRHRRDDSR